MTKKDFDCVEMKRKGGEFVRAETAGMTREQQIAYWKKRSDEYRSARGSQDANSRKAG